MTSHDTTPTDRSIYARMIVESAPLLLRFLAGFDDGTRAAQVASLPNHPIWTLGHCAFTMARFAQLIGAPAPRASDFQPGCWSASSNLIEPQWFFIEEIAKDSTPSPHANHYPTLARGRESFQNATADLAATLSQTTTERLAGTIDWGGNQQEIASLVIRIAVHNGMHAGQLADLRRALGFARILPINPPKALSTATR
ncbi:MAG: DinB family protein [Phycisphaerales bacterium]|nr:DinB family protein [Phycisphaerales bacterium]